MLTGVGAAAPLGHCGCYCCCCCSSLKMNAMVMDPAHPRAGAVNPVERLEMNAVMPMLLLMLLRVRLDTMAVPMLMLLRVR